MATKARIRVDTDALRHLARRVDVAIGMLDRDAGPFDTCSNGIVHHELDGALNDFESDWSDRRHQVHDNLGAIGGALEAIASSFEEVDQHLADALNAPAPPATGAGPEE